MTTLQKVIKYLAMAFAVALTVSVVGGIVGAVNVFSGVFGESAVDEAFKTYEVSGDIHSLEVEINAADFTIKQADHTQVESNLKHLSVTEEAGVLRIRETKTFGADSSGAVLTVCLPPFIELKEINIVTGAGRLTADRLTADRISLVLGAGEATIGTLIAATDIDIDGGAGKITVSGGALHNLDLDMGVGQLVLTAALTGETTLDLGIGRSDITVIGKPEAYRLDVEKGIGSIRVDGVEVSNVKQQGSTGNTIALNGGIGQIDLKFKDLAAS